ncbi:MAG: hypothetical protein MUD15_12950 [Desulfobacterota bacterium]|jgi:hypothetical protein|nr:hypothetical protein [Thermodesulfobacteriota bacterium]
MGEQTREMIAIDVLKDIALVMDGMIFERQRAIDALTLFHRRSLPALEEIVRKVDSKLLKERAMLYIQRIKEGIDVNVSV